MHIYTYISNLASYCIALHMVMIAFSGWIKHTQHNYHHTQRHAYTITQPILFSAIDSSEWNTSGSARCTLHSQCSILQITCIPLAFCHYPQTQPHTHTLTRAPIFLSFYFQFFSHKFLVFPPNNIIHSYSFRQTCKKKRLMSSQFLFSFNIHKPLYAYTCV